MENKVDDLKLLNIESGEIHDTITIARSKYNELSAAHEEKAQKKEEFKKKAAIVGRVKDITPYIKEFRDGVLARQDLSKRALIAWDAIKLSLRKENEFFYLRPTVLCRIVKHFFGRVTDIHEASKSISELKQKKFIVFVGRDLYMINHNLIFNGNRLNVYEKHAKYNLFGNAPDGKPYNENASNENVDEYLRSIDFNYGLELGEAVAYITKMTRLKKLASDTNEFDYQEALEEMRQIAKEMNKINKAKFGGK